MSKPEFDESVRVQDDLFQYVNGKALEAMVIPPDRPTAGGFSELAEGVEKTLMADFADFASGKKEIPNDYMKRAVSIYRKTIDTKRRNEEGIAPALPLLQSILDLKDVEDLNGKLADLAKRGEQTPFDISVYTNMEDTRVHCAILAGLPMILPDTTYYAEGNPTGAALLGLYGQMATALLKATPLSEEEQAKCLQDTLAFDKKIAAISKSQLEWADYIAMYNPFDVDEAAKKVAPFDLKKMLKGIFGKDAPSRINAIDPKFLNGFASLGIPENFEEYKHWAYLTTLVAVTPYLSEELRELGGTLHKAMVGIPQLRSIEKQAYDLASSLFSEPVGIYYGETYFGEEAKADVVAMVKQIIVTYQKRITGNTFLSEQTKAKAIRKLETMVIKMGYPDKVNPRYDLYEVKEEENLFAAVRRIHVARIGDTFAKLARPVNRSEWGMPGHMVNACYDPFNNDICFPAAILQAPFYSLKQKREENLGGIGAVIGHEISHAFDNNGARCDEYGNLNMWWTDEDFEKFKGETQRMIKQFDGLPFAGSKVNGELVVSENIADNGGMAVTLEIMSTIEGADYRAYFENWARVWCQKATEQYQQLLLSVDVHSPTYWRANKQPQNFKEFYEAFGVKEGDKLFLPEDERIIVW